MGSVEGLRLNESDLMRFAFSVYQSEKDLIDSTELGNLLRACNLNPSNDRLAKLGATKKVGEKIFTIDECFKLFVELKKEIKDQGCYEDFIELCKLYDKNENGKMLLAELSHSLLSLGETLTNDQVDELFEDCLGEEDDDGFIDYDPFLAAFCGVKKEAPAPAPVPAKKK